MEEYEGEWNAGYIHGYGVLKYRSGILKFSLFFIKNSQNQSKNSRFCSSLTGNVNISEVHHFNTVELLLRHSFLGPISVKN